ncbi:tripartite tricarboxylate transporter substrate binding protein, partial [Dysgonomonas mossii]
AQGMGGELGQAVVVDNRGGAGGNIGGQVAARAPADGYTLFMGTVGTHAINAALYRKMPFDPVKDFAPLTRVANVPNLLVANPAQPFKTVQELIAYAKANPGKINFGSSGSGSSIHLSGELFKSMAKVDMQHVPYRGSSPAVTDLLGGQLGIMFADVVAALPHIRAGKLRAIALSSPRGRL